MIFSIFINIYIGILKSITFVLPDWDLPPDAYYYVEQSVVLLRRLDFILPIDTLFLTVILIASFEIVVILLRIITGFISLLRGGGHVNI